jgi:adenylate cyclase
MMINSDETPEIIEEKQLTEKSEQDAMVEEVWRTYLTTGEHKIERRHRHIFRLLPGDPRCNGCYAPFQGAGSAVVRTIYGRRPSSLNPQLCNVCDEFAQKYQGGAEIELSLLFVDVRGSTALAEDMNPTEYSKLINRFYQAASQVMIQSDALIDKIIGDQVAGMYVPGFAGKEHPRRAIEAAREILQATGYGSSGKAWISLGAGVHTGTAFVGSLGSEQGTSDITVLGDAPNTAARLSTNAHKGEILISESAYKASGLESGDLEKRTLELKGKSEPVNAWVMRV